MPVVTNLSKHVLRVCSIAMITAVIPFLGIGGYWLLTWNYGEETVEGIVFNGAFMLYRILLMIIGSLLPLFVLVRRGASRSSREDLWSGLLLGVFLIIILLNWDRWMSGFYIAWAEPSVVEVLFGIIVGVVAASVAEATVSTVSRLAQPGHL
jgi:uncharacterized membrane protein